MVAGEERLTFAVGETQMVRGVAGSRHRLDRPVRTRHHIAVRQYAIGRIIPIESGVRARRSEEHTSELQSLMRISYAVFCLKKKNKTLRITHTNQYKTDHVTI